MAALTPVILLAEDSEHDVFMLRRAFKQANLAALIHEVSNGDDVVAYLEGSGKYARRDEFPLPDLLLLDLKMPRRDGFEVTAWVRRQPHLGALRIVVLTTSEDVRDVNEAYRLGANSFLTKPILFEDFRNTIGAMYDFWLRLSRAPQTARAPKPTQSQSPERRIQQGFGARSIGFAYAEIAPSHGHSMVFGFDKSTFQVLTTILSHAFRV